MYCLRLEVSEGRVGTVWPTRIQRPALQLVLAANGLETIIDADSAAEDASVGASTAQVNAGALVLPKALSKLRCTRPWAGRFHRRVDPARECAANGIHPGVFVSEPPGLDSRAPRIV